MKKILFIIQSYPSEMSANVLCDEKIMLALQQVGSYEIHALTYRYNFQPKEELVHNINVHRFSRGPLWDMYTWARHQKSNWKTRMVFKITHLLLRLQQLMTIPFYPFTEWWALLLYVHHVTKLYKQEHFDLVIAEHNGLDTLITGYLLKKKFPQIKFMPIFWDALSGAISPKYLPHKFSYQRRIKIEYNVLKRADCAIVMKSHYSQLQNLYQHTHVFPSLVALDLPSFSQPKTNTTAACLNLTFQKNKIYLCFAGTLSGRNMKYLASILDKTALDNLELVIISSNEMKLYVEQIANQVHFPVRFITYMPHTQLLQLLAQVHIFVNLGVNSNTLVASKIFEYMSFGKPLIETYLRLDDANLFYLKKYPLAFLLDERCTEVATQAAALRQFIEQNAHKHVPYEEIAPLFYKNTPDAYVQQIKKLLEEYPS